MTARPSLESRAQGVRIAKPKQGQDKRTAAEYAAALERETDRSLRDKSLWPYTGPQRWRARSTLELGSGTAARSGQPTTGRWASSP